MSPWWGLAAFCRFWRMSPSEAMALPLEAVETFTAFAELEAAQIRARR